MTFRICSLSRLIKITHISTVTITHISTVTVETTHWSKAAIHRVRTGADAVEPSGTIQLSQRATKTHQTKRAEACLLGTEAYLLGIR